MDSLLKVEDVSIQFGGLKAVSDFSLDLRSRELVGLIGPNGAGKTTVFNILTGVYLPQTGTILYRDRHERLIHLEGLSPNKITQLGLARTFQNIRLFSNLTVLENVLVSHHFRIQYNWLEAVFRLPRFWQEETRIKEQSLELLEIFGMANLAHQRASQLPYGQQRKLEIVRALATQPRLLLLDEPAAGMNPQETRQLMELIQFIRERFHLTILLIEHDMSLVMGICERILVLDYGRILAEGRPEEVRTNPEVIRAYLGEVSGA
jgi:branched-chain amino acid transport system ATP-binding protein